MGTTTINALSGAFNNLSSTSLFTSNNNAIFNLNDLNNSGEISVAHDLTTNITHNLNNQAAALIWSGNNATFNVNNNFTNDRGAEILVIKNITIKSKNSGSDGLYKINNFTNNSATIESFEGSITINAKDFYNKRDAQDFKIITLAKTDDNKIWYEDKWTFMDNAAPTWYSVSGPVIYSGNYRVDGSNHWGWSWFNFNQPNLPYREPYQYNLWTPNSWGNGIARTIATRRVESDSNLHSKIFSAGNLTINSDNFNNQSGEISSLANITIATAGFNNSSVAIYNTINDKCVNVTNDTCYRYFVDDAGNLTYIDEGRNDHIFNFDVIASYINASIKSGGSLKIIQNGRENSSFINGDNVAEHTTVSASAKESKITSVSLVDNYNLKETGKISVNLSAITNALEENSGTKSGSSLGISSDISETSEHGLTTVDDSKTSSPTNPIFSGSFKINLDPASTKPLVEARSQFTDISKFFGSRYYFDALGLNGADILANIDRLSKSTTPTKILGDAFVETKLILDQLRSLTNDSFLLAKFDADPSGQVEQLLNSSISEFARLGLDAEDVAMNGLTKEQANSLTKDIVTFELTKVNGISVLAPKIYLSQDSRNRLLNNNALASNSTIFAQGDLIIDSPTTNLVNKGAINSGGNLTLSVGTLNSGSTYFNSGTSTNSAISQIKSGADLSITSHSITPNVLGINLRNTALDSGEKILLTSNNDISILNDKSLISPAVPMLVSSASELSTLPAIADGSLFKSSADSLLFSASAEFSASSHSSSSSSFPTSPIKDGAVTARSGLVFNAVSDIEINSSGNINVDNNHFNTSGSIYMDAVGDINNSNYTIRASENVVMSATNVNNIHADAGYNAGIATTNETRIEAGNIVSIDASNDINNVGATIKAGSLVYLTAGNDINNLALVNYKINGSVVNGDGSAITESQALASNAKNIRSDLVAKGNIESGGNVVLVAGNDINNKGSDVTAVGSAYLEATNGNVNVTTAALRDRTVSSWGSKKKGGTSTTDNTTNVGSTISSGGNLELVASGSSPALLALPSEIGNINVIGSDLTSADNMTLSAKNDVNIESAQNTSYSFSAGRTGRGKSFLNSASSTTQIGSNLTTTNNGNISITSGIGNTDIVGSENAKGSIAIVASKLTTTDIDSDASNNIGSGNVVLDAKENLTISSAINSKYSESFSSKKGMTIKKSSTQIDGTTTNVKSEITATGNVATSSGDDTNIIASNLSGLGSGSITSGGETNIFNGVDTVTHYSNSSKERKGVLSQLPVVEQAFQVIDVLIGGLLNGITGGNYNANGVVGNSKDRIDTHSTSEKIVSSNLNFTNDLTITSDSDLSIRSSNIKTTAGDIDLTSNFGNVSITAATAKNTSERIANGKTDRSKDKEEISKSESLVTQSEISSGKNLDITSSSGDLTLQAAKLTSGTAGVAGEQDLSVNADGNIYLLAASNSTENTDSSKSKGTYSFTNGTSGHIYNTIINNEIRADGGSTLGSTGTISFNTDNTIVAQYKNTGNGTDVSGFASSPALAYLNSLDPSKTIYNPIDETHIDWDQTTRGLTKTGTAVVAIGVVVAVIAVTIVTAGTGTAAAASAGTAATAGGGAAAGGTAAAAGAGAATAGGTAAAAGAGAGAVAGGAAAGVGSTISWAAVGSAALNTAATTALTTATISATNASMNADGDIFKQLKTIGNTSFKDTTSSDSLRNIAIAAITAGTAEYATQAANLGQIASAANSANTVNGTTTAQRIINNAKLALAESAVSNGTSSIIQSVVNGDSTSKTLTNLTTNVAIGAIDNLTAKEIGIAYKTDEIDKVTQLTLHAGLGCAMGAASGGNCGAGAIAGVVGEITGDALRPSVDNRSIDRQTAIQIAGISGGAAALLTSAATGQSDEQTADNIFAGQRIGGNAAENNALYIGGKVKIPGSDSLTGEGNDYDLNSGLNIGKGLEQKSIGTDGKGSAFYVIPTFGLGGYINLIPHGEDIDKTVSIGYKNFISADYLITHQNNNGYGISLGISTTPITWIPANITIDNSNQSNSKK